MKATHRVCFNIGSNLGPEKNIPAAIALLEKHGRIAAISRVCETLAVGTPGPNYLNLSLLLLTTCAEAMIKTTIVRPIEARLGRIRTADKNSPRTIDIDLLIYDGRTLNVALWELPFLAIPTADIAPDFRHPQTGERLIEASARHQRSTWYLWRDGIPLPSPSASEGETADY